MIKYASELTDFVDLLRTAAQSRNIPAAIVEKDYYVTRALKAVANAFPKGFLLKGGTSLSKGWGLLDRFSEDLDLLLLDGPSVSKTQRDKRMKRAEDAVGAYEGFTFSESRDVAKGEHRTSVFTYSHAVESLAGLGSTVILEMGTRGQKKTASERSVQSIVGAFSAQGGHEDLAEDLAPFEYPVQDLKTTFVEKLFAVYAAYEKNRAQNKARHYYDLSKLCQLEEIAEFAGSNGYFQIVSAVKTVSSKEFPHVAVPEADSFAECPALQPKGRDLEQLERNYVSESYLFFGPQPSLAEILESIGKLLPRL